ncbi:MAG TPA: homocysteine S-methyltransferase family protein [Chthoniobacterales bacterium]
MDLLDELQTRVLCGDGAMGTLLLDAGIPLERCFEELCVTEPERIETIHRQYISAGARVIETNTFGANAVRLERFGFENRVAEINRAAAQIASKAARGKAVYVAGSVGPLGISEEEAAARGIDRAQCFREQISALLEGGAQLIFFETFTDFREMEIAVQAKNEIGDYLTICSFASAAEGRIASAMSLVEAFARLEERGVKIVGVNCMNDPPAMVQLLQRVQAAHLLSAYASAGYPKYHDGRFIYQTTPDYFAQAAREMVLEGARLIGGCCGTNPSHVAAIAAAISNLQPVRSKTLR